MKPAPDSGHHRQHHHRNGRRAGQLYVIMREIEMIVIHCSCFDVAKDEIAGTSSPGEVSPPLNRGRPPPGVAKPSPDPGQTSAGVAKPSPDSGQSIAGYAEP